MSTRKAARLSGTRAPHAGKARATSAHAKDLAAWLRFARTLVKGEGWVTTILPPEQLSVALEARGSGIGGLLLDAVDELLLAEGDLPLTIAVMTDNEDALRFYQRRGLVPGEVVLFRFPDR